MKALRWHGRNDVRLDEIAPPQAATGTVVIEVLWCGICGTDLKEYQSGPLFIPTATHPSTGQSAPIVLGHEFSGRVHEVGENVVTLSVGDRVTVDLTRSCGRCRACLSGEMLHCENLGFIGTAADGAFAQYVAVPAENVHILPDAVSDVDGALVEPLAFAVHAVRRSGLQLGDTVAVIGAGPIGLMMIATARAAGATRILSYEPSAARRTAALAAGATEALDPEGMTKGPSGALVDVTFECVGSQPSLQTAIDATRRGGTVVVGGIFHRLVEFDVSDLVLSERRLVGTLAYSGEFPNAIALVASGRVNLTPFITARIALDDIVEAGFNELIENKERNVKIIVTPALTH